MWLEVYIPKRPDVAPDLRELAGLMGLSCGIIHYKAVLDPDKVGHYTRLYDPAYLGQTIEVHREENSIELSLNFPAAPYDVELFFRLTEKICRRVGSTHFYMDTVPIPTAETPDVIRFYQNNSADVVRRLCQEARDGERKTFTVYGTRFPIVLGQPELQAVGGDLYRFAFLVDRLQRTEAEYPSPDTASFGSRYYGVYELPVGRPFILPEDPETLVNRKGIELADWIVNLGRTDLRFSDFIANIPAGRRFDEKHRLLTLDAEAVRRLEAQFGFDTAAWEVTGRPGWGIPIADGNFHAGKVPEKHLNTDGINGYNHVAVLLRWCAEHGLLNEALLREYPELPEQLLRQREDLRPLLRDHPVFRGRLCRFHLNERGRAFAVPYHDAGWDGFPGQVDFYAEARLGKELYNCPEYQDEAYLFVPFDEDYWQTLSAAIDRAWERFLADNG